MPARSASGSAAAWIHRRWLIGGSFIGLAAWTLKPDKMEGTRCTVNRCGVFFVTLSAFFLAEMGDKTQLATIALAAELHAFVPVVAGTTFGMLVANVPIVLAGDKLAARVPLKAVRKVAAALFIVFGIVVLLA